MDWHVFSNLIASPQKIYLLDKLDHGYVMLADLVLDDEFKSVDSGRTVTGLLQYKLVEILDDERLVITEKGHNINKYFIQVRLLNDKNPVVMNVGSDQYIPITGYYSYVGHKEYHPECKIHVPMQAYRMFFKKNEIAPKTGACEHDVNWYLVEAYRK